MDAALTDVYMDFLHPRINHRVLAGACGGRRTLAAGRGRARCHRAAAEALLRAALQSDRRKDVTAGGRQHRGGLSRRPLALAVRGLGSRRRRLRRVLGGLVVVERVRLEGSRLRPLGAVVVRRVAGQIVAVGVLLAGRELGVHIVGVDHIGAHGH